MFRALALDHYSSPREGLRATNSAGTTLGHQLVNPFDQDLVYLAIGPNEVCVDPDSGKVLVRSLK